MNVAGRKDGVPLPPDTALAYRVNDAAKVAGLSRSSKLYELLIGEGKLLDRSRCWTPTDPGRRTARIFFCGAA